MNEPLIELTCGDVEKLIDIVSKLQHINHEDLLREQLSEFEKLLGVSGSLLSIYNQAEHRNEVAITSGLKAFVPNFIKTGGELNGRLPSSSYTQGCTVFYECQSDKLFACLGLRIENQFIQQRQKKLIEFMQPHFFACVNRYYLIKKRLHLSGLTNRENEVMKWIVEGKDNWSIGQILGISERTIKFHVGNILKKLGVYTKTEVICEHHRFISSLNRKIFGE